jgi:hypothetical protein
LYEDLANIDNIVIMVARKREELVAKADKVIETNFDNSGVA